MKALLLILLSIVLGLSIGCTPDDRCDAVECGPGDCIEGICECPDGFYGANCEIQECFGVGCVNGYCDPQTKACNCNSNYYGEGCNILCVNGEFVNGACNCSVGYEGIACEIESRDGFLGWWSCQEWSWASQSVDSTFQGPRLGAIKFDCGNGIPQIKFSPTENSSGLMRLSSTNRIVGQVSEKSINFELQYLRNDLSVYGSAILGSNRILNLELHFSNSTTSTTEVARGKFTVYRYFKDCM